MNTPLKAVPATAQKAQSTTPDLYQSANQEVLGNYTDDAPRGISMMLVLSLGLVVFVAWASLFELDQSVRARGEIISSARTQIIQVADGGVLAALLVHEGQAVEAGQRLAILEKERARAAFEESRAGVAALKAALVRTSAEVAGEAPEFGSEFNEYPDFVAAQLAYFNQRKQGLDDELNTLALSLTMAREELRMNQTLLQTGDASRLEFMRAQRQVAEIKGEINSVRNNYLQLSREDTTKLEAELAGKRYQLQEKSDMLHHTDITAPVTGVVKYLKLNTLGGVLRSGDELMQISPTESDMVVEVKINPVDIGDLTLGLPVSIKLDAFDFSVYGSLNGTLTYISSDTLTEEGDDGRPNTYYRATVTVDPDQTNPKLEGVLLKPGMQTTVDIKTGERSVLHYLAKPLLRAFGGALNER